MVVCFFDSILLLTYIYPLFYEKLKKLLKTFYGILKNRSDYQINILRSKRYYWNFIWIRIYINENLYYLTILFKSTTPSKGRLNIIRCKRIVIKKWRLQKFLYYSKEIKIKKIKTKGKTAIKIKTFGCITNNWKKVINLSDLIKIIWQKLIIWDSW